MRLLAIVGFIIFTQCLSADERPNIVLLIGDDHGYPYFGFMGDQNVVTPTMDALAEGGVTYTNGMVTTPYCRPSLRAILTGLHPTTYNHRVNDVVEQKKVSDENYKSLSVASLRMWNAVTRANAMSTFDTLPKLLKQKGYVSWQGGKWWENSFKNGHFDEGMTEGWDMSLFGHDDFFHEMMGSDGNELVRSTMKPLYDFIDKHGDSPKFIWFGPMLPHTPFDAPYRYRKYFEHKDISESAKQYYANIAWWDEGVSDLMDYLESKGELDNTLFIYMTDNGWEQDPEVEYWRPVPEGEKLMDSEYLTGGMKGKGSLEDLGLRTPIIFYWKDKLKARMDTSSLITTTDIFPTLLELVGIEHNEPMLDGASVLPAITGKDAETQRQEYITYSDNMRSLEDEMGVAAAGFSLRNKQWHFYHYPSLNKVVLYDVVKDPRGNKNLASENPELVKQFISKIDDWKIKHKVEGRMTIHE